MGIYYSGSPFQQTSEESESNLCYRGSCFGLCESCAEMLLADSCSKTEPDIEAFFKACGLHVYRGLHGLAVLDRCLGLG